MASDPKVVSKYATGYSQCASEVTRYLAKLDGLDSDVKSRLASHLNSCVQKLMASAQASANMTSPMTAFPPLEPGLGVTVAPSTGITQQQINLALGQLNTNLNGSKLEEQVVNNQTQGGALGVPVLPVQLIPAKLPSGDVVLLLTNNQTVSSPNQTYTHSAHTETSDGASTLIAPISPASSLSATAVAPDSSTSPKEKTAPVSAIKTSPSTTVSYSDLIRPYPPAKSFSIFPPQVLSGLAMKSDLHRQRVPSASTSSFPDPPSPQVLDLSDPNKDLNNNYYDVRDRNSPAGGPDNDPMWRPW